MLKHTAGLARLFTDNWDGDGSWEYDFGYPWVADYDDPYPDPVQSAFYPITTDSRAYAGGLRYNGCYADVDGAQTNATLSTLLYTDDDNTRTSCVRQCVDAGFAIAGTRDKDCFCSNEMAEEAREVVSSSCRTPCPGSSGTVCGGDNRLSLFAL